MFHLFETLLTFLFQQDKFNSCDDFVDRLNRKYTVLLLIIFVTVLNSKQYIGEPLSCFCPAHFTGAHVEYTNNICMISRSFYIAIDKSHLWPTMPASPARVVVETVSDNSRFNELINLQYANLTNNLNFLRVENLIAYYPFFLIGQAILFYIPFFFWKNILNKSAYDLKTLIFIACETQYIENQFERERSLKYLLSHIERAYDYYNRVGDAISGVRKSNRCFGSFFSNFKECTSVDDYAQEVSLSKSSNKRHSKSASENPRTTKKEQSYQTESGKKSSGNFNKLLFRVYLIKKLLYISNSLAQFLLLSKFVAGQTKSNLIYNEKNELVRSELTYLADNNLLKGIEFGYKSIESLIKTGNLVENSGGANNLLVFFHTVVFCDFQIRMLGDRLQRYTIQCVVPINVYSEKIFAILWFWLLILNIINVISFLKWLLFYFSFTIRFNFVYYNFLSVNSFSLSASAAPLKKDNGVNGVRKNGLSNSSGNSKILNEFSRFFQLYFNTSGSRDLSKNAKFSRDFLKNYLIHDRIFILKLISENTNEIITKELITLSIEVLNKKNFYNNHENTV